MYTISDWTMDYSLSNNRNRKWKKKVKELLKIEEVIPLLSFSFAITSAFFRVAKTINCGLVFSDNNVNIISTVSKDLVQDGRFSVFILYHFLVR